MPFYADGHLKYFCFDSFSREELVHGIYTRHGGVSPKPWASLNLGGTVGDDRANVIENRKRIFYSAGRRVDSIFDPWQVHGTEVLCTQVPRPLDSPHQKADSILTNRKEVTLFMRFADCTPIFLYDPQQHVVGLVHAGWKGTVARAAQAAVEKMVSFYGCHPKNIVAGVGPSICVEHYPVGDEVVLSAKSAFGSDIDMLTWKKNGNTHFNLSLANQLVLERCGVKHIEQSNLCTVCQNEDWFSHRAENGETGRFGALLALA